MKFNKNMVKRREPNVKCCTYEVKSHIRLKMINFQNLVFKRQFKSFFKTMEKLYLAFDMVKFLSKLFHQLQKLRSHDEYKHMS